MPVGLEQTPEIWRAEKRLIDLHLHINSTPEHLQRAVSIMDRAGIGVGGELERRHGDEKGRGAVCFRAQ